MNFNNNRYSNLEKSYAIHTDIYGLERKVGRKDDNLFKKPMYKNGRLIYCNPDSDENSLKQQDELRRRYFYLYQKAPLILAFMVFDSEDIRFREEVEKQLGFKFKDSENVIKREIKFLSCFDLLEDMVLGDDVLHENELKRIIWNIEKSNLYESVKTEFDLEKGNIGVGKFDLCMKLLLDSVYSFVEAQSCGKTVVYKKSEYGGLVPLNDVNKYTSSKRMLLPEERKSKLATLEYYYEILGFRNERGCKSAVIEPGFSYPFSSAYQTLVCSNPFIEAFKRKKIELSYGYKSGIYFDLHDEFFWGSNAICNKIHDVENGCGNDFLIKEEDIFYKDDKFKVICPCCGSLVTTLVGPGKFRERIEQRIKNRFKDDAMIDRKIELLSELTALSKGSSEVKALIKEKK